ncbi:MAG: APC family permease [Pseudonocardiaceae bacterium]
MSSHSPGSHRGQSPAGLVGSAPPPSADPRLARRLGLGNAVVLGLGSMLGAGVFAAFGPAAAAAGAGLMIALGVAAVIAYCNAVASAQLAARYPESGGTYLYGRRRLGPVWGFLAGWGFVVGKTASCVAMALTFGAYTWPARTIPLALGIVVAVYALVGASALVAVGPAALAAAPAPLAAATQAGTLSWLTPAVRIGGAVATAGVLLSLMAGVGRTTLAMARDHELPHMLAAVHPRYRVPHRAEIMLGALVVALVLVADLRGAIGFSSFAVLTYYVITNAAAFTLPGPQRHWLRPLTILGATGCALLALTLPTTTALTGTAVLALGLLGRTIRTRRTTWPRRGRTT